MRIRNPLDPEQAATYQAIAAFRQRCFVEHRSAFLPDDHPDVGRVWTTESTEQLIRSFVEQPDTTDRGFLEKLADQLRDAPPSAAQLLEELCWFHIVIARFIGYDAKRRLLDNVLGLGAIAGPTGVYDEALHKGLVKTGPSFNIHRPFLWWFLIKLTDHLLRLGSAERAALLDDPWAFRELVFSIEGTADQTQRHAVLHQFFPMDFEDCVSQHHKALIAGLARPGEEGEDVDRTIANVRRRLSTEYGEDFSFYTPSLLEQWNPGMVDRSPALVDVDPTDPETVPRSAWLVRGSGGAQVPSWLERGVCAIQFEDTFPFELPVGESRERLRQRVDEAGVDTTAGGFSAELGQVWRFINSIEEGDYVVTVNGPSVYVGTVSSGPIDVMGRSRRETTREVEWLNADRPASRSTLSPMLYSKMRSLLTLSNISSVVDEVAAIATGVGADESSTSSRVSGLQRSTSALADKLLVPQAWLDDTIDLLESKRQLIFHGPPGTGKTFVAQALADHLLESGGTTELVQFHPSYTYEDFFEGYRPVTIAGGGISYEVKPGPLRQIADAATAEPDAPHVLVIDEINRANLAKVFGELYFLLEYRDRSMRLQYSDDDFSLPPNLYVIGTMNTADRSIALVDAAMRRRFFFVEMSPLHPPIDGLLARWLSAKRLTDRAARLLAELNRRVEDPDLAIGPSYLMDGRIDDPVRLRRIWEHSVLPLLADRLYGTGRDLGRFSLDELLRAVDDA